MLIVRSACNWVPVAGITLAPAWTLDLQINSNGKSSETGNNLFSNKPLGSQLISTVGVRKVPLSDWNRKRDLNTGFYAVAANACRAAHLTLHLMASISPSAVREEKPSVQIGQSGSEERSFLL